MLLYISKIQQLKGVLFTLILFAGTLEKMTNTVRRFLMETFFFARLMEKRNMFLLDMVSFKMRTPLVMRNTLDFMYLTAVKV